MICINDHIDLLDEEQTEGIIRRLPSWRRDAALQFKHLQGRKECALGYVELLRGLRLSFGIQAMPNFNYGEHGKPSLREYPDIHFSISHCKVAVGCMVSKFPCGLDVERIRKAKPELVRRTMNQKEQETIWANPFPDIAFTRLWTQKEALLKLLGTGIVDNLHSVLTQPNLEGIQLTTTENPLRGYVFSVAVQNESTHYSR